MLAPRHHPDLPGARALGCIPGSFVSNRNRDDGSARVQGDPWRRPVIVINYRENVGFIVNNEGRIGAQPSPGRFQFLFQFIAAWIAFDR